MKKSRIKYCIYSLLLCLGMVMLSGCGKSDAIQKETSRIVREKANEALALYADIEKLVKDNGLQTESSFSDMKRQLTDMSAVIQKQSEETTEEDGQSAIVELDKIIDNLQTVKESVEESIHKK